MLSFWMSAAATCPLEPGCSASVVGGAGRMYSSSSNFGSGFRLCSSSNGKPFRPAYIGLVWPQIAPCSMYTAAHAIANAASRLSVMTVSKQAMHLEELVAEAPGLGGDEAERDLVDRAHSQDGLHVGLDDVVQPCGIGEQSLQCVGPPCGKSTLHCLPENPPMKERGQPLPACYAALCVCRSALTRPSALRAPACIPRGGAPHPCQPG